MIQLFAPLKVSIDIPPESHVLHGSQVRKFEEDFAAYVGAKYACSFNSASSAIFLVFKLMEQYGIAKSTVNIPSVMTPVVPNAVLNAGWCIKLVANNHWVGDKYLLHNFPGIRLVDSAQAVDADSLSDIDADLTIYSFYPTKPVPGIDGGMIVGNSKDIIEHLRILSMNGAKNALNSWERETIMPGWKMYMSTAQAMVAANNLKTLEARKSILDQVKDEYTSKLGDLIVRNSGHHLLRVRLNRPEQFVDAAKDAGIMCGLHYSNLAYHPVYMRYVDWSMIKLYPTPVSIPFHHKLTHADIDKVSAHVLEWEKTHAR